jgi:hypothetical protein
MSKYSLLPSGAVASRYGTKEFKLNKRVYGRVSIANDGIILSEGTNLLIIDDDVKISESELKSFVDKYFTDGGTAFKRINAVINPSTAHKTIF